MDIERASIYCRGADLAFQAGIAAAFITDHGLSCNGIYVDEQGLDSWQKLTQDCARGFTDAIIIQKMEVLTEDASGIKLFDELLPIPIIGAEDLYCSKENLDLETLQYEKPKSRRTKEQKQELDEYRQEHPHFEKEDRFYGGIPPFGYIWKDDKLVPDPSTASFMEQMFIKARDGEQLTAIAGWLDDEGISTPRGIDRWSDNTVKGILRNSVYVDDLINRELFLSVQERFDSKPEAEKRPPGIYQGIVMCSTCGKPLAYHGVGGKDRRKTAIYSCKYHTGKNPKEKPLDHMPKIEEEKLKAEVLKQCNSYIQGVGQNDRLMKLSVKRFETKMKTLEEQMRKIGEKALKHKTLYGVKVSDGLWDSWELTRRRYMAAMGFRFIVKHRFAVFNPEQTAENDFEQERKLYQSIMVSPEGKVTVQFWGDIVFEWD